MYTAIINIKAGIQNIMNENIHCAPSGNPIPTSSTPIPVMNDNDSFIAEIPVSPCSEDNVTVDDVVELSPSEIVAESVTAVVPDVPDIESISISFGAPNPGSMIVTPSTDAAANGYTIKNSMK